MAKKIKRSKAGIELKGKRGLKAKKIKYVKTKALNGEKFKVSDFEYEENQLREAAFHQEALTIKNQIKAEMEDNISKKLSKFNEIDFDNDGDFDLLFTRSKEFEIGETFYDKETKVLGFFTKRGKFKFEDLEVGDVLNLENFQSQWPNADTYFIGESGYDYKFPGETHSGKNIKLVKSYLLDITSNCYLCAC